MSFCRVRTSCRGALRENYKRGRSDQKPAPEDTRETSTRPANARGAFFSSSSADGGRTGSRSHLTLYSKMWISMVRALAAVALCTQLVPDASEALPAGVQDFDDINSYASSLDDLFQIESKRGANNKYCGKHLANALHLVCDGVFFNPGTWSKKSVPDPQDYWQDELSSNFPFRSRAEATQLMPSNRRVRRKPRGIVDECCLKSCSINEMKSYCGPH
ncbi:LIRP isoform X2 [Neocloeon triangulifer]|uniref:LIRP isoform X2 n=1 Tax=Neocloeon triangulifer TaxID=2078957 RepID=UPI00286F027A|nr:LIRP isoform X2 [Neocloeon triangulifer]